MGAVFVRRSDIYQADHGPVPNGMIELFHGYTYSGHPLAAAAGIATLDIYAEEGLFERTKHISKVWEDAAHSLKGLPHVIDVRNYGLIAGIEMEPREGAVGARGYDVFTDCFHNRDVLVRPAGDIIASSPPLIIEESQIAQIFDTLADAIRAAD